jgi:hypothetical protein
MEEAIGEIKKMMKAILTEDSEVNHEEDIPLDIIEVVIKEVYTKIKETVGEIKIEEAMEEEKKLGIVIMKMMIKIIIKMEEKKAGVDRRMKMNITKKEEDIKIRVLNKNIVRTLDLELQLVFKDQMSQ